MRLRVTGLYGRRLKYVGHQWHGEPVFVRSRTPLETPAPVVIAQTNNARRSKFLGALSRFAGYISSLVI